MRPNQCSPCITSIRIHWSTRNQLVFEMTSTRATAPYGPAPMERHVHISWKHIANNCRLINPVFSRRYAGVISNFFICVKMAKRWLQHSFIATCVTCFLWFSVSVKLSNVFSKIPLKKKKCTDDYLCEQHVCLE